MGKKSKKRKRLADYRFETLCAMIESVASKVWSHHEEIKKHDTTLLALFAREQKEMEHLMAEVGKCFEAVQVIRRDIQTIAQRTKLSNHREADILDELRLVPKKTKAKKRTPKNGTKKR